MQCKYARTENCKGHERSMFRRHSVKFRSPYMFRFAVNMLYFAVVMLIFAASMLSFAVIMLGFADIMLSFAITVLIPAAQ